MQNFQTSQVNQYLAELENIALRAKVTLFFFVVTHFLIELNVLMIQIISIILLTEG